MIAKRIGRSFGFCISHLSRRLTFRLQKGWNLTTFSSLLRNGLCSLASGFCRRLFTLSSNDGRNLRRDYKAHCSRFADMFQEDCVALLFLAVSLHNIELSATDTERRDNARDGCFHFGDIWESVKDSDAPIKRVHIRRGSGLPVFSV